MGPIFMALTCLQHVKHATITVSFARTKRQTELDYTSYKKKIFPQLVFLFHAYPLTKTQF